MGQATKYVDEDGKVHWHGRVYAETYNFAAKFTRENGCASCLAFLIETAIDEYLSEFEDD